MAVWHKVYLGFGVAATVTLGGYHVADALNVVTSIDGTLNIYLIAVALGSALVGAALRHTDKTAPPIREAFTHGYELGRQHADGCLDAKVYQWPTPRPLAAVAGEPRGSSTPSRGPRHLR